MSAPPQDIIDGGVERRSQNLERGDGGELPAVFDVGRLAG